MPLRGVVPKTNVDGFIAELIKHRESLIESFESDWPMIDYCYEIDITCDGTNPYYSRPSLAVFVISQFTDPACCGIVINDETLPVIIISTDEVLQSINVAEGNKEGQHLVIAMFAIYNPKTGEHRTPSWIVRKSEAQILN